MLNSQFWTWHEALLSTVQHSLSATIKQQQTLWCTVLLSIAVKLPQTTQKLSSFKLTQNSINVNAGGFRLISLHDINSRIITAFVKK